ncbi:hypothetical protein P7H70_05720 [Vagococcus carniphilus]|uniref:Uncharacterized protein n=1 Tax=Vagococcus carniphilus TaxID=218144 RepID=A0AAW8U714_9ENTE|nr:hypothetical protein [Vagococcus carniphilus]MDT2833547.1 hypothetical protein [Vagococcus carniphilus]
MKITKRNDLPLIVYAFFLIFSPPILPKVNILLLMTIFSVCAIVINWNTFYERALFSKKVVYSYAIVALYFLIVILLNTFFSSNQFINNSLVIVYKYFILIPAQYICSIFLIDNVRKNSLTNEYLYTVFVKAGVIQGVLAIISFVIPSVKEIFIKIMSNNTGSDIFFQQTVYSSASEFRFFGFSRTLLDTFGFGMGILCILALHLMWNYKRKYIFAIPILLVSIMLNSRSGLLVFLVGTLFYVFFSIKKITLKQVVAFFFFTVIIVATLNPLTTLVGKYSPNTLVWIQSGFSNLFSFILRNEKSSYEVSDVLFSKQFWTFPSKPSEVIFGSGHDVYKTKDIIGIHSDVGYVNQFWLGGILGSIMLIVFFIFIFINAKNKLVISSENNVKILYVLSILFLIMNVKADLISYNPGTVVTMCIVMNFIFEPVIKKLDIH